MAGANARSESFAHMWRRRALTVPLYHLLWLVVVGLLPLVVPVALAVDVVRRDRWILIRCVAFFTLYLSCEVIGIWISVWIWLVHRLRGDSAAEFVRRNFVLQQWWANALFRGGQRIFDLHLEVEGADCTTPGPYLFFIRHASMADTVLPVVIIGRRHQILLRYVIKAELLWDPCLDIGGHRLPNSFVWRDSDDTAAEVEKVAALADGLGAQDGVLIYPEGTRFTPEKRQRALERLARGGPSPLRARAEALRHMLPPRLGGPLALLERAPGMDVVFCGHVGMDGITSFNELRNGRIIGRRIRVCFWRVPGSDIPRDRAAQAEWLFDQWARLDAWVGRQPGPP